MLTLKYKKILIIQKFISYLIRLRKEELTMSVDVLTVKVLSEDKIIAKWKLSHMRKDFVATFFGKPFENFQTSLRIYDITDIHFNGHNAHLFHEFMMKREQDHWLIKGISSNRHYCLELGIHLSETEFFPLLRSVPFHTACENGFILSEQEKESDLQKSNHSLPKWSEHVSTYSYYETVKLKGDQK